VAERDGLFLPLCFLFFSGLPRRTDTKKIFLYFRASSGALSRLRLPLPPSVIPVPSPPSFYLLGFVDVPANRMDACFFSHLFACLPAATWPFYCYRLLAGILGSPSPRSHVTPL